MTQESKEQKSIRIVLSLFQGYTNRRARVIVAVAAVARLTRTTSKAQRKIRRPIEKDTFSVVVYFSISLIEED